MTEWNNKRFQKEVHLQKQFQINYLRCTKQDWIWANQLHLEEKKFEQLYEPHFLTGEEHFWHGSSSPFKYGYPLVPIAFIYFPDRINEVNIKRKEMQETRVSKDFITSQLTVAEYDNVYLSLEELNPVTGERVNVPKVTGLAKKLEDGKKKIIRDPDLIGAISYNPRALRDRVINFINGNIMNSRSREEMDLWKLNKKLFSRYYRID